VSEEGIRIPGERTKNRRPLLFPWTTELRAVIAGARARVDRLQHERGAIIPWVFPREDGERLGDFKKSWKTACRRAGVPGRLRHDFRRTAARDLVRAGVPERQVMELLGWKTRAMLDRYHIVSQADLDAAATKIDRARGA
jgi:integrase